MQFTRETSSSHLIRAVEQGRIRIGEQWFSNNLIVTADRILSDWALATPGQVTAADLGPALALKPELVIVGAGTESCMPDVDLMAELAELSIGLEFMQTGAACRTFNVLVHEGRRVAAALILDLQAPRQV
jgi:uncharacterized protein